MYISNIMLLLLDRRKSPTYVTYCAKESCKQNTPHKK